MPQHRCMSPRASPRKKGDEPRSLQNDDDDAFPNQNKLSALVAASALMKGGRRSRARDDPSRERGEEPRVLQYDAGVRMIVEKVEQPRALQHDLEAPPDDSENGDELQALQRDDVEALADYFEKGDEPQVSQHDDGGLSGGAKKGDEPQASMHDDDALPDDSEQVISIPLANEDDTEGPSSSLRRTQLTL